ncbi:MAG TPA: NUDIX domain-containing protein, partial [Deinococcales bacterium]|nr:NUDIX domain-containing protein [Deinococcales bacterium]
RGKVLLIKYPPSRGGAWAFPKGHVEAGETLEQTAVREVQEEGGVTAKIRRLLGETRYSNSRGVRRTITWYEMRTPELRAVPEPGFRAVFLPPDEALRRLTHAPDRETLQRAVQAGDLPRRGQPPEGPAAASPPSRTVTTKPEEVP